MPLTEQLASSRNFSLGLTRQDAGTARHFSEFILVFLLAGLAFGVQAFCFRLPNSTLVFDALGFLNAANACLHAWTPKIAWQTLAYVVHGFPEGERVVLLQNAGSIVELAKTGPLTPVLLALAYAFSGSAAVTAHWTVGAATMIVIHALIVTTMWLIGCQCFSPWVGRLSAVVGVFYCGFAANATRLLSEAPTALSIALAAWSTIAFLRIVLGGSAGSIEDADVRARPGRTKTGMKLPLAQSAVAGCALALVVLSRSVFLLLPLLLVTIGCLLLTRRSLPLADGLRLRDVSKLLAVMLFSMAVTLLPWILCKQIITGQPSLLIERRGPWNLFVGWNVSDDGFDVLPNYCVTRPDAFPLTMQQALVKVSGGALSAPLPFIDMMLRKPARLIDSPWNDFQVSAWGLGWQWHTWWHQVLILLSACGSAQLIALALMRKRPAETVAPAVLSAVIAYHLIYCLFLCLPRYFVTAMPEVIVLAVSGLLVAYRTMPRYRLLLLVALTALTPTVNWAITALSAAQCQLLPLLAAATSVHVVAWGVAAIATAGLATWFYFARQASVIQQCRTVSNCWCLVAVGACLMLFLATKHCLQGLEFNLALANGHPGLQVRVAAPAAVSEHNRYFLLVDFNGPRANPLQPDSVSLFINDERLNSRLLPLLELDDSQRENFVYERVFASSAGVEPASFRQWWAAEIPFACVQRCANQLMDVRIEKKAGSGAAYLTADFYQPGQLNQSLSIRRFSWSKGFNCNPPGEVRMPEYYTAVVPPGQRTTARQQLRPRVYLLSVDCHQSAAQTGTEKQVIRLPDTTIGTGNSCRFARFVINVDNKRLLASRQVCNAGIHIRVTGSLRSPSAAGQGSIALMENLTQGTEQHCELAPLAPGSLSATSTWRTFEFDDHVALNPLNSHSVLPTTLDSVCLMVCAVPWFDALQYQRFRPNAPVEFKDLQVELNAESFVNLDTQHWQVYRSEPISL